MTNRLLVILGIPLLVLLGTLSGTFFIVDQSKQALILEFGQLVRTVQTPGLKIKIPFVQDLVFYEKRILDYDVPTFEVTLGDQKRVVVDIFARYRITNPGRFYQTLRDERGAQLRLAALIPGSLRSVLGNVPLGKLLSPDRAMIMTQIKARVTESTKDFGIEVVDVRIRRADLPEGNSQAVFDRMISERRREAQEFRAEGQEKAQEIRSTAEKNKTVILAKAKKEAQILRGDGDAIAAKLYGEAYGKNPEFAQFYRALEAYRNSLSHENTTYVLSPKSDFFKFFSSPLKR